MASSDHKVVWAGTGEAWAIRDVDMTGDGVYKSTDEGKTWTHMGLDATGRIGRIVIHPTNPDVVFVCALGRLTGPQQERGVYRTTRWRKELGTSFVRRRRTPAAPAWPWIRTIRACCLPECGKWRCTPTACSAAARPARFTFRATAAASGLAWKVTDCQNRRWAKSTSRLPIPIPAASTH